MRKEDLIEIDRLFETFIKTVNPMLKSDFYTEKEVLLKTKVLSDNWYDDFKNNNSLTIINV